MIPLLLGVSLSRMAVFAGFELNRDYIASKLCENRDKAWMHCEGKCYLSMKLKQVEEKESKQEREIQKQLTQDSSMPEAYIFFFGDGVSTTINTPYCQAVLSGYETLFFHPPRV
ncbi:hypothetical protein [Arcticibacter sp.]|uniref:hypothetical protein n=1 Tax=Arcticibacter sp. TaxID=1872630 RepID=UPI00388D3E2F